MAYADSYFDYVWEITQFNTASGLLTVTYNPLDSLDSSRATQYQRFTLGVTQYDSASIIGLIEGRAQQVVAEWDRQLEKSEAADSGGITIGGIVGLTDSDRYKPFQYDSALYKFVDYNPLVSKSVQVDSETATALVISYVVQAKDSDEKVAARNSVSITANTLFDTLQGNSSALEALGFKETTGSHVRAQTSFDGSAGAGFNYANDKYDDYGVDSVSRTGTGEFVITFSEPMPNGNFTVLTGVGDQDYGGAGASPRQVAVIARDSNSVTVLCERTDDAVNEDNTYISLAVLGSYGDTTETATFGEVTVDNIRLIGQNALVQFGDSAADRVQTALGHNDSQFAQYLLDNGGSYGGAE